MQDSTPRENSNHSPSSEEQLQAQHSGRNWLRAHSHHLSGLVLLSLFGFGVTAFGVAPMAPDAQQPPAVVTVLEDLTPGSLLAQSEQLSEHDWLAYRSEQTRSTDTADTLLHRLGAKDEQAAAFLRSNAVAQKVLQGRAGKLVRLEMDRNGQVQTLLVRSPAENATQFGTHYTRLTITRGPEGFVTHSEQAPLTHSVRMGEGTIQSSLFAAADAAGLPDVLAIQIAEMFSADIDFHRDLRRGDRFTVVYEALEADGEPITWNQGTGRVLAAEFVNKGRARQAVWFHEAGAPRGAYYTLAGESLRRAFLSSPMEFSRVTSPFGTRMHPILQQRRQHNGVDYGAPTGTPVRTVGDGVVEFAGWQNGYGNVVFVRHRGQQVTVYAHLSRIGVRKGQRVEQAQHIGNVGATGWATGPHLHFEFRVNGQHTDPLRIVRASQGTPLAADARPAFELKAQAMQRYFETAERFAQAAMQ